MTDQARNQARSYEITRVQQVQDDSKYIFNPSITPKKPATSVPVTKPLNQVRAILKNIRYRFRIQTVALGDC